MSRAPSDPGLAARRQARAGAEVKVFRPGEEELRADAEALYWDRIPLDERAEFVWRLSVEVYQLANPTAANEPGLSRSIARIIGR